MFNADDVKTGTVAVCVCVCVCHGACSSCVEEHATALHYKECIFTFTQYHISVSDKERRLRVSISTVSQNTRPRFTHIQKAQPLTAPARRCSSGPLRECPITIAYHHHHLSSFLFIGGVGAGLVQGLSSVPLPTPYQLLDCRKHLLFPIHNYVY